MRCKGNHELKTVRFRMEQGNKKLIIHIYENFYVSHFLTVLRPKQKQRPWTLYLLFWETKLGSPQPNGAQNMNPTTLTNKKYMH